MYFYIVCAGSKFRLFLFSILSLHSLCFQHFQAETTTTTEEKVRRSGWQSRETAQPTSGTKIHTYCHSLFQTLLCSLVPYSQSSIPFST